MNEQYKYFIRNGIYYIKADKNFPSRFDKKYSDMFKQFFAYSEIAKCWISKMTNCSQAVQFVKLFKSHFIKMSFQIKFAKRKSTPKKKAVAKKKTGKKKKKAKKKATPKKKAVKRNKPKSKKKSGKKKNSKSIFK